MLGKTSLKAAVHGVGGSLGAPETTKNPQDHQRIALICVLINECRVWVVI